MENATFSVPEIQDLRERVKSFTSIGDFSTIGFTMIGLGEPREVRAGVVGGTYFDVMGLHPVMGRLLDMRDDGPAAAGAVVLTYRFWTDALKSDPAVLGKVVRLESFGPKREPAGDDYQPKRGAADVSGPGGAQSECHVYGPGDEVYRHEADAHAHRRNCRGYRR